MHKGAAPPPKASMRKHALLAKLTLTHIHFREADSGVCSEPSPLLDDHEIHAEPCWWVVGWRIIVEQNPGVSIRVHAHDLADGTIDVAHAITDTESLPPGNSNSSNSSDDWCQAGRKE